MPVVSRREHCLAKAPSKKMASMKFGDRPRFRSASSPLCGPIRGSFGEKRVAKRSKGKKEREREEEGRLFTARSLFRPCLERGEGAYRLLNTRRVE